MRSANSCYVHILYLTCVNVMPDFKYLLVAAADGNMESTCWSVASSKIVKWLNNYIEKIKIKTPKLLKLSIIT